MNHSIGYRGVRTKIVKKASRVIIERILLSDDS